MSEASCARSRRAIARWSWDATPPRRLDRRLGRVPPTEPRERRYRPPRPFDLARTLGPLQHGYGDPTMRRDGQHFWRATRTAEGPATVAVTFDGGEVRARAWGAGAELLLDRLPALLGADDEPSALRPCHGIVAELARRFAGVRFARTEAVFEALVPAVVEQKVTGIEARRAYRTLLRAYGEPAPGPAPLRLTPRPEVIAGLPAFRLHPLGLETRRADVLRRAAVVADRLEETTRLPPVDARARLMTLRGIGPWTAAETTRVALGDPDAVSVGDFHVPNLVAWALSGEPRGDDARMLELLEPYRGQRARVVRLLEAAGLRPPRYGPRAAPRSIATL
jgi:3-methyladenine DNA glycosylase/8-oxoguanine DNA glycosylase